MGKSNDKAGKSGKSGKNNDKAINRIKRMEEIFDKSEMTMNDFEKSLGDFENIQDEIKILADYLSSDDFKNDYDLDEAGKLPKNLKRGVLAQDAIFDLLERNDELKNRNL